MKKSHAGVVVAPAVEEYCVKPVFDADGVQVSAGIRPDGKEVGDPVRMEPPVGYHAPSDVMEMIKSMVRNEMLMSKLSEEGFETFDEADDFEVEDDPLEPLTEYERIFEAPAATAGDRGNGKRAPQDAAVPPASSKDVTPAAGGPSQTEATPSASDLPPESVSVQHCTLLLDMYCAR